MLALQIFLGLLLFCTWVLLVLVGGVPVLTLTGVIIAGWVLIWALVKGVTIIVEAIKRGYRDG